MARKPLFFLGVLLFITSLGIAFSQTRLAKANLAKSSIASLDVSPTDFVVDTKVPDTPIIESSQVVTSDSGDSPADFFQLLKSKTLVAVRSNWVYFLSNPDLKLSHSIELDGKQEVQFSLTKVEDPPASTREFAQAVQASENRYTFDEETGFLVRFESIAHLQDGSQRAFASIQVEIKPGVNPPPEVLEYFKMKQDREGVK